MSRMRWDLDDDDTAVTLFTEIGKLQGEIGKQFVRILSTDIAVNIQHPIGLILMWDTEYDLQSGPSKYRPCMLIILRPRDMARYGVAPILISLDGTLLAALPRCSPVS